MWPFGRGRIRGIRIETFVGGGHYQHKIMEYGVNAKNRNEMISQSVVDAQKRLNELAWDAMPQGSSPVVSEVKYKIPKDAVFDELRDFD